MRYCNKKGEGGGGNYVEISISGTSKIYIDHVRTDRCKREGEGSVGEECSCKGLVGHLLDVYSTDQIKTIELDFEADPKLEGCR